MENDCSVLKPIPYPYNPFEIEGKYAEDEINIQFELK